MLDVLRKEKLPSDNRIRYWRSTQVAEGSGFEHQ